MQVQDRLRTHPTIQLRIGLHIGDVTRSQGELYGDGIISPPGWKPWHPRVAS